MGPGALVGHRSGRIARVSQGLVRIVEPPGLDQRAPEIGQQSCAPRVVIQEQGGGALEQAHGACVVATR